VLENDDDDESLTQVVRTGVAVLLTDESFEDVKWKGEMVLVTVFGVGNSVRAGRIARAQKQANEPDEELDLDVYRKVYYRYTHHPVEVRFPAYLLWSALHNIASTGG
jgi:hypothetical protein